MNEIADILESELQTVQPAQLPSHPTVPSSNSDRSETQNTVVTLDLQCRLSPFDDTDTSHVKDASPSDAVPCDNDKTELPATTAAPDFAKDCCQPLSEVNTLSASSKAVTLPSSSETVTYPEVSMAKTCESKSEPVTFAATSSEALTSTASAAVSEDMSSKAVRRRLSSERVTNSAASSKVMTSSAASESLTSRATSSKAVQSSAEPSSALTESSVKSVVSGRGETLTAVEQDKRCVVSSDPVPASLVKLELPESDVLVTVVVPRVPCTMPSDVFEDLLAKSELSASELPVHAIDAGGTEMVCESVLLPVTVKSERAQHRQAVVDAVGERGSEGLGVDMKPRAVQVDQLMPLLQNNEFGVAAVVPRSSVSSESTILTGACSVSSSLAATSDPGAVTSDTLTHESSIVMSLSRTVTPVSSSVTSVSNVLTSVSVSSSLTSTVTPLSITVTSAPGTVPSRVANCVPGMVTSLPSAVTSLTSTVSSEQHTVTPLSSSMACQSGSMTRVPWTVICRPSSSGGVTLLNTVTSLSTRAISDTSTTVVQKSESLDCIAGSASSNVELVVSDHCEKVHRDRAVSSAGISADGIPPVSTPAAEPRVASSASRATAVCVRSSPAAMSVNDSFSEDELHIVLPDDSFTASEPAADSRLPVSLPVENSAAPDSAAVNSLRDAATASKLSAVSHTDGLSADLVPCIADILAEMLLFRPLSPVPSCQRCTVCENASAGNPVVMTRKRSITQRRLSEHSDDDASVEASASSDHVRASRTENISISM